MQGAGRLQDLLHINDAGKLNQEEVVNFCRTVELEEVVNFCGTVELEEVVKVIKGSSSNKSLGPDGFNALFYKVCWPIIGSEVFDAISNFFEESNLLRQVKNNFITLIPKCGSPSSPTDFSPIAIANEIYKIIARVIAGRLKPLIDKIISPLQSAFIRGRSITDNLLLSHDIVRSFCRT